MATLNAPPSGKMDSTTVIIVVSDQPAHSDQGLRGSLFSCLSSLLPSAKWLQILIPLCWCAGGLGAVICANVVRSLFAAGHPFILLVDHNFTKPSQEARVYRKFSVAGSIFLSLSDSRVMYAFPSSSGVDSDFKLFRSSLVLLLISC